MQTSAPLVIASYNVHGCVGLDRRWRPERVAAVVKELGADVVGIQEVRLRPAAPGGDELARIAEASGFALVRGPTREWDGGDHGNGLLTRLPLLEIRRIDLSHPNREPRGAIDAELAWGEVRVRVVATHLGLHPGERRDQCRILLERLTPQHDADVAVLLGDFNEWWAPSRLLGKLHRHFGRSRGVRSFPSPLPLVALDRVWVKPAAALKNIHAHRSRLACIASDHLPVRAEIHAASAAGTATARILQPGAADG